jgi:hypothetical protein
MSTVVEWRDAGDERHLAVDSLASTGRTQLRLPTDLSIDNWRRIGERITAISDASGWWLGDWLIYGQERYPDRYRRAIAQTSLDYQTLRNYVWVARRFEPSRRRASLSIQHHISVAALPPNEQDHWLQLAEKFTWSRNELRRQLRNSVDSSGQQDDEPQVRPQLNFEQERIKSWNNAAMRTGRTLLDWMTVILDEAAADSQQPD